MNNFHVVFALDRHPETVDALFAFAAMHAPVFWFNAGNKIECRDIEVVFRNGNGWPYHEGPWHLFHREKAPARSIWFDPYEHHSIEDRMKVLQEMANSYSWAILPWGREESMAMIAFVTTEERYYDDFIAALGDFQKPQV
jgi:hypothetical protein